MRLVIKITNFADSASSRMSSLLDPPHGVGVFICIHSHYRLILSGNIYLVKLHGTAERDIVTNMGKFKDPKCFHPLAKQNIFLLILNIFFGYKKLGNWTLVFIRPELKGVEQIQKKSESAVCNMVDTWAIRFCYKSQKGTCSLKRIYTSS